MTCECKIQTESKHTITAYRSGGWLEQNWSMVPALSKKRIKAPINTRFLKAKHVYYNLQGHLREQSGLRGSVCLVITKVFILCALSVCVPYSQSKWLKIKIHI